MPVRKRTKRQGLQDNIAKVVLGLLPVYGPHAITPRKIAQAMKVSEGKIAPLITSFDDCIPMIVAMIDAAWETERPHRDPKLSAADLLFDVLMLRFDVMEPYREGLGIFSNYARSRPQPAVALCHALTLSMKSALNHIEPESTPNLMQILALTFLYGLTFEGWLRDSSTDKAPTMAALDRRIKKFVAYRPFTYTK